jgi:DNA-binding CsgD family transcriptional regulator
MQSEAIAISAVQAALDQVSCGIALIDARCRVRFINRLGRVICQQRDGLELLGEELIGTTTPEALRLVRPSGRRPLSLRLEPLHAEGSPDDARFAIVWMRDPDCIEPPPRERLMEHYGLTPAEAGITRLLLRGLDLAQASASLRITIQTARTHLRSVLGKTGTHRQSELLRLVLHELGSSF